MIALKSAVMVNIQSHTRTVLEFPEVGIVRFCGNNSNGKSVFVKALGDIVNNSISRPAHRRSLVRRGCPYGELKLTSYDDTSLYVRIALEAADTYAELTRADGTSVRRYMRDRNIPNLVREFGWHYDTETDISLNLHQDVDDFLFVDTKPKTNFELLNCVRSDPYAEAAEENLQLLLKETKKKRADFQHDYEVAQAAYTSLQYWDIEEEERIRSACLHLAKNLQACCVPPMPVLHRLPDVRPVSVFVAPPPTLHHTPSIPVFTERIPDVRESLQDLISVLSGVCPTCGKKLL